MPLTACRPTGRLNGDVLVNDHRVLAWTLVLLLILALPRIASAVPSFARQTGMPCSQCHTLSFGPALTPYGRQFKLNGYTFGEGEHPMPLAFMVQGGFSHTDVAPPADAQPAHFAPNNNVSVDQVSVFLATRLTEHIGMFSQSTYSGEDRHFSWDNTDIRYARPLKLFGTDAVVGISVNNNPTVQDLWHSSPAWAYPYIGSPLVPGIGAAPIIGGLGGVVAGATAGNRSPTSFSTGTAYVTAHESPLAKSRPIVSRRPVKVIGSFRVPGCLFLTNLGCLQMPGRGISRAAQPPRPGIRTSGLTAFSARSAYAADESSFRCRPPCRASCGKCRCR